MEPFEQLGSFYLGHRIEGGERTAAPLLYRARDLTTHGLCVGMTGSGKTGLSIVTLEEAAIDGIPAIVIDPKGDLSNLLLTFPGLTPAEFAPWIDPAEAGRHGRTPEAHAEVIAERWRSGLARDGQDGARIARFAGACERVLYTPGSEAGRPLSVLGRLDPPAIAADDPDALRDEVAAIASALCALLDVDGDPITSAPHILLAHLITRAWSVGTGLDIPTLVRQVLDPPFDRLGALPLDDFFAPKDRKKLGMKLNHLLASPSFAPWMKGDPLDVGRLLRAPDGRPRLSILSIAHLSESERMFFVTLLLSKVVTWMRAQSGTASLRALLFMDEVFGFFPPVREPPSKRPMLTLLKQARAYGLGVLLSTQNPVDLDYKGLSNCGTWLLGRLSTERDVDRVIDGLATAGAAMDPDATRAQLAGLGSRRFLMRNVHEKAPVVFETRWAMSYLRGPLTRTQLVQLARPVGQPLAQAPAAPPAAASSTVAAVPATPAAEEPPPVSARPALDPDVRERFLVPFAGRAPLSWRPHALAAVSIHYSHRHSGLDLWLAPSVLAPLGTSARATWEQASLISPTTLRVSDEPPLDGGTFEPIPRGMGTVKGLGKLSKGLKTHLYREEKAIVYRSDAHKAWSEPGEDRASFVARLAQLEREDRDRRVDALREKYAGKVDKLEAKLEKARDKVEREKGQLRSGQVSTAVSVGTTVLGALFGRSVVRRAGTSARGAARNAKDADDVRRAEEQVDELEQELVALSAEARVELKALQTSPLEPPAVEERAVKPTKSDLSVDELTLVWVPYREGRPAWAEEATQGAG
ncbi:MAG: ATP-binding protein [Sandaracinaceae bacterium]